MPIAQEKAFAIRAEDFPVCYNDDRKETKLWKSPMLFTAFM
jgi:hypothetical protein